MAVFTAVSEDELRRWLQRYSVVGPLIEYAGIASGIENTNFFVTTTDGRYVLTLFEKLTRVELPFYLNLMAHLARHGVPSPAPIADDAARLWSELNGKPAALVVHLHGTSAMQPTAAHCAKVGTILAQMHLATRDLGMKLVHPRGPHWWRATAPAVRPFLTDAQASMLDDELKFQFAHRLPELPRGVVHADLFRDNVLFTGGEISGVIDFYFAGDDVLLFDLAVSVNDWCVNAAGELDAARTRALLEAYHRARPLTSAEHAAWPLMLRAAALRFWLSRLYDQHVPRPGEIIHPHDPQQFGRILARRQAESAPPWRD
jgi:homoserine kinase type II